jgi:hypothetical protein
MDCDREADGGESVPPPPKGERGLSPFVLDEFMFLEIVDGGRELRSGAIEALLKE